MGFTTPLFSSKNTLKELLFDRCLIKEERELVCNSAPAGALHKFTGRKAAVSTQQRLKLFLLFDPDKASQILAGKQTAI